MHCSMDSLLGGVRIVADVSSERRLRTEHEDLGGWRGRLHKSSALRLECRNRRPELPSFPSRRNPLFERGEVVTGLRQLCDVK
jgi:hypothetical protein